MSPATRKFALEAHLFATSGWLGAVVAFVPLAIGAARADEASTLSATCVAMNIVVRYAILPCAFASLVTGIVSAVGTKWGLFQHYWVVAKLALVIVCTVILIAQLGPIERIAAGAAAGRPVGPELHRPLVHGAGGLVVLLIVQALSVYKPWGRIRRAPS